MTTIVLISHFSDTEAWVVDFLNKKNIRNIAIITDAKTPRLAANPEYKFVEKDVFEAVGIRVVMVNLERDKNIEETLRAVDAIYIKGGNCFYLLNAMRTSGFSSLIKKLADSGTVYIGESAGAYVACPTIEMASWKHQDADIVGMNDLTGLNLVPFLVSVHYDDALKPILEPYISSSKYEVKPLRNNEIILYESNEAQLIEV